jgi:fructokinase
MRIGVDLGGTKIEAIALEGERVLARRRVPAPKDDYDRTLRAVCDLVIAIQKETGQAGTVGVGIPGTVSVRTGLVKNANSVWIIGRPLDRDLSRALGQDVRVANDANCFALSEATDGAAKGAHTVFGVIIGTGTGAGIVIGGQVLEGRHRIAGEWGHNPLPWPSDGERPGAPCYCGRTGCIETFLSGPGLSRTYAALTNMSVEPADIASRAGAGDNAARSALETYETQMARALATVINVVDPDVIVLGGGLSNIDRLYENVPA